MINKQTNNKQILEYQQGLHDVLTNGWTKFTEFDTTWLDRKYI